MFIEFNNSKVFYTSEGSGNALVLLHGFLESTNIWKNVASEFSRDHHVICIDLPGHGKSECLGDVHSMEEMAEVVHAVLTELKVSKAHFIGHSMGGYVSLAFLEQHPETVEKLSLLNSTPAEDSEERKTNRDRAVSLVKKNKKAFVSMAISNLLTPENHLKFKDELEKIKSEALEFPTKGITAALKGMKIRIDRTALLTGFKGEKHLIAGKQDPILNYEGIKNLAQQTNCRFYTLPGGHLAPVENREELFQALRFID